MRTFSRLFIVVACVALAGCGHVISSDMRKQVDKQLDFATVKANPDRHVGARLLVGGLIVNIELAREGTTLELFSYRLDAFGEPVTADENGGRMLLRTDRFLDPALYMSGRFVTAAATVTGRKTKPLGELDYTYPVLTIDELYLWDTPYRYALPPFTEVTPPMPFDYRERLWRNPYDPNPPALYPYSPFWWRGDRY